MKIKDYFSNHNIFAYQRLQADAYYKKTIDDFYNDFIYLHLRKLFRDHKSNLVQWCTILEDYANGVLPIFWIRKFESGSGKAKVNDNRRTGTTVLVNKSNTATAAYVYVSNFDAQELYNMILNVDPSGDFNEFKKMMLEGEYKFHYDNGVSSAESTITSFECLAHANSLGVFNRANLYLAHIVDVNGEYASGTQYSFTSDNITDWKEMSSYAGFDFLHIFTNDPKKKIRVLTYPDSAAELNSFLKAHFFRFVHPFNYYLVPGQNYEVNAILGKTKRSIGEYHDLTDYVKYRMYVDFIKGDADLERHYELFESSILIDDNKKITKNFTAVEAKSKPLGNNVLHIIYGTSVGEEGMLLEKLSKNIINIHELDNLYNIYNNGDTFIFRDLVNGNTILYTPQDLPSYVIMLKKLSQRGLDAKAMYEISLKKGTGISSSTKASGKKTSPKAAKKAKAPTTKKSEKTLKELETEYTHEKLIEVAACYLSNCFGLKKIERQMHLKENLGFEAQNILQELGIITDGTMKNCLNSSNIDSRILNATGILKDTLIEIKNSKLL